MTEILSMARESLDALFAALAQDGRRILAPTAVAGRIELQPVQASAQVAQDYLQTTLSAKETVFPKVERLLSYTLAPGQVTLQDHDPAAPPTVLFGLRPCEAAGFASLDAVFNWDCRDKFFNARREQLTVIGVSCTRSDAACFCTAVGGGPSATQGSDILLTPLPDAVYLAEILTPKGAAIKQLAPELFQPAGDRDKQAALAQVEPGFDQRTLAAKLPGLFDSDIWVDQSLRCIGCGACAYVCPTCACFDLQEEADLKQGQRLRCGDSCGLRLFTLHASGHNPRDRQSQRWRQRIYHKFSYFPERFGRPMCVGCGKCTRACPVDMNLQEHLSQAEAQ